MSSTANRRRRNAPCPCGSGKKYKHCHGAILKSTMPSGLKNAAQEMFANVKSKEIVRNIQQGYGRPIISEVFQEYRIVAVSNRLFWSKNWKWFTDFLIHYLKDTLGRDWGVKAQRNNLPHPVFEWLGRLNEFSNKNAVAGTSSFSTDMQGSGYVTSVFRLAYSLYLIEHHDQLDKKVVKRLQKPAQFRAAYYETILAAAFAVSGAKIEMAEQGGQSVPSPEFYSRFGSGNKYSIEAKCKSGWNSDIDFKSDDFRNELRQWIRDQIYNASKKNLFNPVYCFELGIPDSIPEAEWRSLLQFIGDVVDEAQNISIKGKQPVSAYIIVTNIPHLADDNANGDEQIAMLFGFKKDNFIRNAEIPIDMAMEWHDQHRDINLVLSCMEEVHMIPSTFDGTPPEFQLSTDATRLQIGKGFKIEFPDKNNIEGVLRDVVSMEDKAHVVIENTDGKHLIAQIPLTEEEALAAKTYGDAVFGKPHKKSRDLGDDPLKFYDWITTVYSTYSKKNLMNQIPNHVERDEIARLSLREMRIKVAREITKAVAHDMQNRDRNRSNNQK